MDLQDEPLWGRSVKVEGPGSGGRREVPVKDLWWVRG